LRRAPSIRRRTTHVTSRRKGGGWNRAPSQTPTHSQQTSSRKSDEAPGSARRLVGRPASPCGQEGAGRRPQVPGGAPSGHRVNVTPGPGQIQPAGSAAHANPPRGAPERLRRRRAPGTVARACGDRTPTRSRATAKPRNPTPPQAGKTARSRRNRCRPPPRRASVAGGAQGKKHVEAQGRNGHPAGGLPAEERQASRSGRTAGRHAHRSHRSATA